MSQAQAGADSADLSSALGPVRDQGRRGTCLAFAVTAVHEHARTRRRATGRHDLSEEYLYWASKQVDCNRDPGTSPRSMARALADRGQPSAELWPYDAERDDQSADYQPPAQADDPANLALATVSEIEATVDRLTAELGAGRSVVVGLDLWPQFFERHGGDLGVPDAKDLLGEGHAVVVVGYRDSERELLIRNSWGAAWGDHGHARLPYDAWQVARLGAWTVEDDIDP